MNGTPDDGGEQGAPRGGARAGSREAPGHVPGPATLARHGRRGLRRDALAIAAAALAALGDLVVTGPTGTNVNDLNVALRGG